METKPLTLKTLNCKSQLYLSCLCESVNHVHYHLHSSRLVGTVDFFNVYEIYLSDDGLNDYPLYCFDANFYCLYFFSIDDGLSFLSKFSRNHKRSFYQKYASKFTLDRCLRKLFNL